MEAEPQELIGGCIKVLKALGEMIGYKIHTIDEEIGHLSDFLFEDSCWKIRYLVVKTGRWYSGVDVVISPMAIDKANWDEQWFSVLLKKQQINDSPELKSNQPVSRKYEKELLSHYNWPFYWGYDAIEDEAKSIESEEKTHVRSVKEVIGYEAKALEGQLGSVKDLIVNCESWAIKYFIVSTGLIIKHARDLAGKDVIVPAGYLGVSWAEKDADINLPLDIVKSGPEFDKSDLIDSDFEKIISDYYDLSGQKEASRNCRQENTE